MGVRSLEVAVVGAGVAGLYASWRLCQAGMQPADIALFEASDRAGGRILTVTAPDESALKLDLGAHLIADDHARARMLAGRLGLSIVPYRLEEPGNLLHLRGRTRSVAQVRRSFCRVPFPYAVPSRLQKRGAGRLMRKAREKIAAQTGADGLFRGRPPCEWPLDAILREVLHPDEVAYLVARSVYSFWEKPLNAGAVIDWATTNIFMPRTCLGTLQGGMTTLTEGLVSALRSGGVPVHIRHALDGIDLPARRQDPVALRFTTPDGPATVWARRVVLALPRQAIGRIAPLRLHASVRMLLDAVEPWPVTTAALVYPDTWWTPLGFHGGRAVTDLPARLMRYHAGKAEHPAPAGQAAITFYADGVDAGYWGATGASGWVGADHPATRAMQAQVSVVHCPRLGRELPEPSHAFVQEWAGSPAGGAFHLWALGSDPHSAMAAALRPIDDVGLHVCGEAWSSRQGWIEGSLETADALLDRHFGLGPLSAPGA